MGLPRQDTEPPMVVASRWVHQITTIAFEMALPAGAGFWLDRRWGTSPWLVVLGACFGFFVAGVSLAQLIKRMTPPPKSPDSSDPVKFADNSGPSTK